MYKRYIGNTGKFYRVDDAELPARDRRMAESPPEPYHPPQRAQPTQPSRQPSPLPFSLFSGSEGLGSLRHLLGGLLPDGIELGDLLLILILLLLYLEKEDEEILIILSVLIFMGLK